VLVGVVVGVAVLEVLVDFAVVVHVLHQSQILRVVQFHDGFLLLGFAQVDRSHFGLFNLLSKQDAPLHVFVVLLSSQTHEVFLLFDVVNVVVLVETHFAARPAGLVVFQIDIKVINETFVVLFADFIQIVIEFVYYQFHVFFRDILDESVLIGSYDFGPPVFSSVILIVLDVAVLPQFVELVEVDFQFVVFLQLQNVYFVNVETPIV